MVTELDPIVVYNVPVGWPLGCIAVVGNILGFIGDTVVVGDAFWVAAEDGDVVELVVVCAPSCATLWRETNCVTVTF